MNMFSKIAMVMVVTTMTVPLLACGEKVEVPPAHVGKILTANGYKPNNVPPSKFRLDMCFAYCDSLVVVETADRGGTEKFRLFMPKDQLNMEFDIRYTASISAEDEIVNAVLAKIPPEQINDDRFDGIVSADRVYDTYGRPIVREVVRTVISKYTINEVGSSRDAVNAEIFDSVRKALKGTPVEMKRIALADVQFPDIIVKAKEVAKEREIQIGKEEADKQIRLKKLEADLEVARKDRAVRREKAEAAKEEAQIYGDSMTEAYVKYRTYEILEALAKNDNTVFVPMEALGTIGLQNRIFNPTK